MPSQLNTSPQICSQIGGGQCQAAIDQRIRRTHPEPLERRPNVMGEVSGAASPHGDLLDLPDGGQFGDEQFGEADMLPGQPQGGPVKDGTSH